MIHALSDIGSIAAFFQDLCLHCSERGIQAAHEIIRTRISDRHLQEGLTLAADGNHPAIVGRYLSETLPRHWEPDLAERVARAVSCWQTGQPLQEIMNCLHAPVSD
ncbi:MAG: hypothetical protein KDK23_09730 [Leptospiraceae bacterium]|nr:hypothetical protein [Leptospiraceae bacterium]